MQIAIMQPYFFPYIGYFQLIDLVDKFVIYDDVNFINRGWVNRNNILLNNNKYLVTVPLLKQSQNKLIKETLLSIDEKWKSKTFRTIESAYKKAPFFRQIFELIQSTFSDENKNISRLNTNAIKLVTDYLNIETEIIESSQKYNNTHLKAQDRILDICKKENAAAYINPIGGVDLYSKQFFEMNGIKLNFIKSIPREYPQYGKEFVPWLSVIDILMFNPKDKIRTYLTQDFKLL